MAVIWFIVKCILWLLAAVLGLVAFVLLVPVTAEVCYEKGEFTAAVRVLLFHFRVYPWPEKQGKKQDGFWQRRKTKASIKKQKKVPKKQTQQEPPKVTEQLPETIKANPQQLAETDIQQSTPLVEESHQKVESEQKKQPEQTNAQEPAKIPEKTPPKRKEPVSESGRTFLQSIDKIKILVSTAGTVIRRILAGFRIHHIRIVLPVHMSDAAETALAVGYIHAGLHTSLGVLNNFFNLQFKQLVVIPDYHNEYEGKEHFSCKITTHLIIMVVIAIWALVRLKKEKIIG